MASASPLIGKDVAPACGFAVVHRLTGTLVQQTGAVPAGLADAAVIS